jgi:hypothetical protein
MARRSGRAAPAIAARERAGASRGVNLAPNSAFVEEDLDVSASPSPTRSIVNRPGTPEPVAADPAPLLFLVVSLLRELHGQADILECTLLACDNPYAIRLHAPREMETAVLLPRAPLERGLVDPRARIRARNLVRSAMEALRGRPAVKDARLAAYFKALDVRALPGPRCVYCEAPLLAEDPVVIRGGSSWHLACPPAW